MDGVELKKFCSNYPVPDCLHGRCPHLKLCDVFLKKLGTPCTWCQKEIEEFENLLSYRRKYDKIYGTKKSSNEWIN